MDSFCDSVEAYSSGYLPGSNRPSQSGRREHRQRTEKTKGLRLIFLTVPGCLDTKNRKQDLWQPQFWEKFREFSGEEDEWREPYREDRLSMQADRPDPRFSPLALPSLAEEQRFAPILRLRIAQPPARQGKVRAERKIAIDSYSQFRLDFFLHRWVKHRGNLVKNHALDLVWFGVFQKALNHRHHGKGKPLAGNQQNRRSFRDLCNLTGAGLQGSAAKPSKISHHPFNDRKIHPRCMFLQQCV